MLGGKYVRPIRRARISSPCIGCTLGVPRLVRRTCKRPLASSQFLNAVLALWIAALSPSGLGLNDRPSNGGVPRRGDKPIPLAVLFDMTKSREWVMKPLHHQLLGHQHVVDFAAGGLSLLRYLIEY